ncbi:hypothetical protein JCM9279_001535 [Rhodotorula babjevae]
MSMHTLPSTFPYPSRKEDRDAARLLRTSPKVPRPLPSPPPRTAQSPKQPSKSYSTIAKLGSRDYSGARPLPASPTMPRSQAFPSSLGSPLGASHLPSPPTSPSRSPLSSQRKRKSVEHDEHGADEKDYAGRAAQPSKKRVVVDIRKGSSSRAKDVKVKAMPLPPSPSPSTSSTLFDELGDVEAISSEDEMPTYDELLAAHLELKAAHTQLEAKYAAAAIPPDSLKVLVAEAVRQGLKDEREAEQRRRREVLASRGLVARALGGASMAYSAIRLGRGLYRDGMWAMGRIAYAKAQVGALPAASELLAAVQGFL